MPVMLALLTARNASSSTGSPSEDEVSVVFSFAGAGTSSSTSTAARGVVGFLRSILPRKARRELYIASATTALQSEYYADLSRQIPAARLAVARARQGRAGMKVVTLPSYYFVFTVIKDHFPSAKLVPRARSRPLQTCSPRPRGPPIDFQRFEESLPRPFAEALSPSCAPSGATRFRGKRRGRVRHLYVARRVEPLDLFLATRPLAEKNGVSDWGGACRPAGRQRLRATSCQDFGVTRHAASFL